MSGRGRFDGFAETASRWVSEAGFFVVSVVLVLVWVPTIWLFHSVDTWQLVLNTVTSVMAFLLIALLQNSERRYDRALHAKVDALATVVVQAHRGEDLEPGLAALEASISLEERI
jgi:low affinity Fe/Cu permease